MSPRQIAGVACVLVCALVWAGCGPDRRRDEGSDDEEQRDAGTPGCAEGLTLCAGACVDVTSSATHCGGCRKACSTGQSCNGARCEGGPDCRTAPCTGLTWCDVASGECRPGCASDAQCGSGRCDAVLHACACAAGTHWCGGGCVPDSDATACGETCAACTAPANGTPICDRGRCDFSCRTGSHRCGNACLANDSVQGCGTSCTPCEAPPGAIATCESGRCGFRCADGYLSCGGTCARCPSDPGVTEVECSGSRCVAVACGGGTTKCGDSCCGGNTPDGGTPRDGGTAADGGDTCGCGPGYGCLPGSADAGTSDQCVERCSSVGGGYVGSATGVPCDSLTCMLMCLVEGLSTDCGMCSAASP